MTSEFERAFNIFDKSGLDSNDGSISKLDLKYILSSLRMRTSDEQINNMLADENLKEDQAINKNEFLSMMSKLQASKDLRTDREEKYNCFVAGRPGIGRDDLKGLFEKYDEPVTGHELKDMMEVANRNEDEVVNLDEFQEVMSKVDEKFAR